MRKKKEKICDWRKKDIRDNLDELIEVVREPKFICAKCGRVASLDNALCNPVAIKK